MKSLYKHPKLCVLEPKNFKLKKHNTNEQLYFKNNDELKLELNSHRDQISDLQEKLYAQDKYSVLFVLQAIDAAGKDSCIKHVLSGINPQGCHVVNFKAPSKLELDHDFIWRTYTQMPERGKIGVFNRSYYEEILVCKVHPEYIVGQNIPGLDNINKINKKFWKDRYRFINEMERHLVKNGTIVFKVFLNMSKEEQKNRFLERIDDPKKQWKFNYLDLKERALWDDYQSAYEEMIQETSTDIAPWYVIPADDQWISRAMIGRLLLEHLEKLKLKLPVVGKEDLDLMAKARKELLSER
jgi:PPK2 family polyphosphate:nucleotide phosphotransferase